MATWCSTPMYLASLAHEDQKIFRAHPSRIFPHILLFRHLLHFGAWAVSFTSNFSSQAFIMPTEGHLPVRLDGKRARFGNSTQTSSDVRESGRGGRHSQMLPPQRLSWKTPPDSNIDNTDVSESVKSRRSARSREQEDEFGNQSLSLQISERYKQLRQQRSASLGRGESQGYAASSPDTRYEERLLPSVRSRHHSKQIVPQLKLATAPSRLDRLILGIALRQHEDPITLDNDKMSSLLQGLTSAYHARPADPHENSDLRYLRVSARYPFAGLILPTQPHFPYSLLAHPSLVSPSAKL